MTRDTPPSLDRRRFAAAGATSLALASLGLSPKALAQNGLRLGPPRDFSWDGLIDHAGRLAARPHDAGSPLPRDVLERIDYDAHGRIRFDTSKALFRDGPGRFPVTFFHLGRYFQVPVHLHLLADEGGRRVSREILYSPAYFDMPADSPARELPDGAGFAGFRFQESRLGDQTAKPWQKNDWVAFLGASYFRAIGSLYQYGLSARGVAVDTARGDRPEEFPVFTHFHFEPPAGDDAQVVVYALLEGPSLTGAYRFAMRRDAAVLMDVEARLFLRRDVARLGLAPLTSMYWYSETAKPTAIDWRPEVHDSDGLAMWTGSGEYIWRPLNNPPRTSASAFADRSPRGFGLWQRDRVFDHYLDGVAYERRPGLWVEPLGDWGEGAVQLIEIPTENETHDNIVAFWVPSAPAVAGARHALRYRLHWTADEPFAPPLARCVATRIGQGGQPGQPQPPGARKLVVEFLGAPLAVLPAGVIPEAVVSASRGRVSDVFAEAVPDDVPGHWRAQFDITADGTQPVDLRLYLRRGDQVLSETWLYQYHPF